MPYVVTEGELVVVQVLLFSMSVRLLHIVESLVTYRGYDYLILEGSTTMQVRGRYSRALACRSAVLPKPPAGSTAPAATNS